MVISVPFLIRYSPNLLSFIAFLGNIVFTEGNKRNVSLIHASKYFRLVID
jgi:hypothetical protein